METFEVVMIGNTSVGKTSMLAALSNELDQYNLSRKITLKPTTKEFKTLQKQWNEMTAQVEEQAPFTTLATGIEGTLVNFVPHEFDFKVDGEKKATVLFTDTKGALTGELDEKLVARVNCAFGVFCVVDASVLMECPNSKNEQYNCSNFVKRLFDEVYNDNDDKQPRFVTFVLTKCETYMDSYQKQRELAKAFHEKYDTIVDMLRKAKHAPNIYVLAVQTMCCVRFFKLDEKGWPVFRTIPLKELATKDCAYPLVILLRNLIWTIEGEVGFFGRLWRKLGFVKDLNAYLGELDTNVNVPDFYEKL